MSLYQNQRNGQIVELISFHDKDYAMVRNQAGSVSYATLSELQEYKPGTGRTGQVPVAPLAKDDADPEVVPTPAIPPDLRLNLNLATAEMIATIIKGVGYSKATKSVELRMGLPGEKFQTLEQVRSVGRVDWEQVIADDLIFVG